LPVLNTMSHRRKKSGEKRPGPWQGLFNYLTRCEFIVQKILIWCQLGLFRIVISLKQSKRGRFFENHQQNFCSKKVLFEILHFYSSSVGHSQTTPSVLMSKKFLTRFFNFCLGAEIQSKNCQNFINDSQLSSSFFNNSHNIEARKLILCMNTT